MDDFKNYRWCDESHFATGLQRQALVHRRRGQNNREKLSKTQYKLKRKNQTIHVFATISWDFKGTLHFCIGTGKQGRLIQADYIKILEEVVAPEWDENLIFVEDNDGPHGTKGKADNKVKQAKIRLGIKWEAQPSNSPDLNPIETIWRTIKQRLKSRGVIFSVEALKQAIQEEWDKITIKEINKVISTMPDRVTSLNERFGKPIPF